MTKQDDDTERAVRLVDALRLEVMAMHQRLHDELRSDYVKQVEFKPVQGVVYGLVSLILIGVLTALLAIVVRR